MSDISICAAVFAESRCRFTARPTSARDSPSAAASADAALPALRALTVRFIERSRSRASTAMSFMMRMGPLIVEASSGRSRAAASARRWTTAGPRRVKVPHFYASRTQHHDEDATKK
jgi:hypothetical protein